MVLLSTYNHMNILKWDLMLDKIKIILKKIIIFCLYYHLILLLIFYSIFIKIWFSLGIRPDLSAKDPKDVGFQEGNLFELSGFLFPYLWIPILFYVIYILITKKNILAIKEIHFLVFILSIILFFMSLPFLFWYTD